MAVGSSTDIGAVRKANEDSFLIDEGKKVFAVADGMGGHENGKLASNLAIEVFTTALAELDAIKDTEVLARIVALANETVYRYQEDIAGKIMGTTFTVAAVDGDKLHIAHIGDSRAYRIRQGVIEQLTNDHSYLAELVRLGEVERAALEQNSRKNVLLKALGPEPVVEAQLLTESWQPGDVLLLCTDGLYNALSEEELGRIIQTSGDLQQAADRLVAAALISNGADNMTVVLYGQDH